MSHVAYEVMQMTWAAGQLWTSRESTDATGVAWNAVLESALLHARSLIEFMLDDARYADDMRPDAFYPGWPGPQGPVRDELDAERKLLHKHLVHLTWARAGSEPAAWDFRRTVGTIVQALGSYADHLSTGAERGEADGAVVRTMRAALLWARQEIQRWSRPVLATERVAQVTAGVIDQGPDQPSSGG